MSYVVTFERIGRKHDVPPLNVAGDANRIAEQIHRYANGFLGSSFFDVTVSLETLTGYIEMGRFGKFTLREDGTS